MEISFKPIGFVHSPFKEARGAPIQPAGAEEARGRIVIEPEYVEGLKDLNGFSHIIALYYFHLSKGYDLLQKPFLDTRPHGVFSIRSPRRPNPIGLSVLGLRSIEVHITNVDILDGTPLLDLKPYVPEFDSHPGARIGWLKDFIKKVREYRSD